MIVSVMSKKYILRFCGRGAKPAEAVTRVKAADGVKVLDDSSPRMLLVAGARSKVEKLAGSLGEWVVSEERAVKMPDTRPRVRSSKAA